MTALDLATQKPDGTVDDAEQDFINRTNKAKSKIAYDFSVTGRTILLRDSPFPISGKAAAIAHPNSNEGTWSWTPKFQGVSVANDFASRLYLRDKRSMMSPRRLDSQIAIWRGVSDEKLWKTALTLELLNVCGRLHERRRNSTRKDMTKFDEAINIFETKDAARYADALFWASFNSAFPVPAAYHILETEIQPEDWRQFVAIYTWPDGTDECVGFCNWIKYKNVYLEGGLAVQKSFYRRLPKLHFADCAARGGVAQIIMETAAATLTDCEAWFGYVGDSKSMRVVLRVGYVRTEHQYLIVKWMRSIPAPARQALIDDVTRIGPF